MKKTLVYAMSVLFLSMLFTSCSGLYNYQRVNSMRITPEEVYLKLQMDDFEYLGQTTISVDYKSYLGIFYSLQKVNDQPKSYRKKSYVTIQGDKNVPVCGYMRQALPKVLEMFPNADYYIPVNSARSYDNMFLGSIIKETVTIKAYKFKKH